MFFEWLEDAARHHGMAHAVIQRDTYLSFRGLVHRTERRMQELRALGLEPGTAVGVLLGNVSDYVVLALAANRLGATLVPIAPLCSARELAHAAAALPLRAIVSRPGLRALEPERQPLSGDPILPAPTKRTRLQGSLLSCALFRAETAPPLPPDTVIAHLRPTATGRYELVTRSAEALTTEAERLAVALGATERLRVGAALPLYHSFTLEAALALCCGYGASLTLDDDLAPRHLAQRLRDHPGTLWPVSRALLWSLAALTPQRPVDPATRLLCVDGPVGRELDQAVHRALGLRPEGLLHDPRLGLVSLDVGGKSPTTVGTVLAGLEVRILGPRQAPLPAGRRGALGVRPAVKAGTIGTDRHEGADTGTDKGADKSADEGDPWVDTGDQAALDPQGRLRLHGRADDLVLVGGLPVSLSEVREVLLTHPAITDAEVSLPPPETPAALDGAALLEARAHCREPASTETLMTHLGRHLSPHKVPAHLEVLGPKTPTAARARARR